MNAGRPTHQAARRPRRASPFLEQARFCRTFPGLYRHPSYPTRDQVIPYRLFYGLMGARAAVLAEERVQWTRSVLVGVGMMFEAKDTPDTKSAAKAFRGDVAAAYPEAR